MIRETCENLTNAEIKKLLKSRFMQFKPTDDRDRLLELYEIVQKDGRGGDIAWDFFEMLAFSDEISSKLTGKINDFTTKTVFQIKKQDWDPNDYPEFHHSLDYLIQSFKRGEKMGVVYSLFPCKGKFDQSRLSLFIGKDLIKITFQKKSDRYIPFPKGPRNYDVPELKTLKEITRENEDFFSQCDDPLKIGTIDLVKKWETKNIIYVEPKIIGTDIHSEKIKHCCEKMRQKYRKIKKSRGMRTKHDFRIFDMTKESYYHCVYESYGNFIELVFTKENYPDPSFYDGDELTPWFEKKSLWRKCGKKDLKKLSIIDYDGETISIKVSSESPSVLKKISLENIWISKDKEYYTITKKFSDEI